jgi:peptidoglycan hydrolase-like protein with peptidoglycan-binding domain
MLKTQYKKELVLTATCQVGSKGQDVKKIQEWLCINAFQYPHAAIATAVDGAYGDATALAVKNFQKVIGLPATGIVDAALFARLTQPLQKAFGTQLPAAGGLRSLVVKYADNHLQNHPRELQYDAQQNLGSWVRSYCNGADGTPYKWCMGFVQTVLDQASATCNRRFTDLMPMSLSCDTVGTSATQNKSLVRNSEVRKSPGLAKPGDVFLLRSAQNSMDWHHTGIISRVVGDCFETIEGNTDQQGSSNGTGVFARTRNFQKSIIDVVSVQALA